MFWTVAYFCVTYGCVCAILFALSRSAVLRRIKLVWLAVVLAAALVPLVPYARVAIQTAQHGKELEAAVRASSSGWGDPKEKYQILRVMSIGSERAEVYVVTSCGSFGSSPDDGNGDVVKLKRISKGWAFDDYDTVWSDCGSAEGNTFPPYPEARSF